MLGRVYGGRNKNKPLLQLMGHLSKELNQLFYTGISCGEKGMWFLVPIALKGDWPALAKIGTLSRTFGHLSNKDDGSAKGICHLCSADQCGYKNWHDISWANMVAMRENNYTLPWKSEPSILSAVPLHESDKATFFCPDPFHTLHKGLFGDIAANAIEPRTVG